MKNITTPLKQGSREHDLIESTADELEMLGKGVRLLVSLLEEGKKVGVESSLAKAMGGLLMPISADLERHAAGLRAAVAGNCSKNRL